MNMMNKIRWLLQLGRKTEVPPDFVLRRKARPRSERRVDRERTAAQ